MTRILGTLVALALLAPHAYAGQSLIPTPYPSAVGAGQPLNPAPPNASGPEHLMDDPYPDAAGKSSQGNPSISRTGGRRQRLVPSTNQRKYRVDRD